MDTISAKNVARNDSTFWQHEVCYSDKSNLQRNAPADALFLSVLLQGVKSSSSSSDFLILVFTLEQTALHFRFYRAMHIVLARYCYRRA